MATGLQTRMTAAPILPDQILVQEAAIITPITSGCGPALPAQLPKLQSFDRRAAGVSVAEERRGSPELLLQIQIIRAPTHLSLNVSKEDWIQTYYYGFEQYIEEILSAAKFYQSRQQNLN